MYLAPVTTTPHRDVSTTKHDSPTRREIDARSAYRAALEAATTSLERAQRLFEAASAAIDAHIARSLGAAAALTYAHTRTGA